MTININEARCPANHKCPSVNVCPTGAIVQKGYGCPRIDYDKCIRCGKCIKYCPMQVFSKAS
ncbi:MAG: 4Fe-4S binding protein [Peptococcaceae bacterium]